MDIGKNFCPGYGGGMGCPGQWWSSHPCRYLRDVGMALRDMVCDGTWQVKLMVGASDLEGLFYVVLWFPEMGVFDHLVAEELSLLVQLLSCKMSEYSVTEDKQRELTENTDCKCSWR